jgi:hypothetical protein
MPRLITVAIKEQVATVASEVPSIAPDILAVAAEIGQIPRGVAQAAGTQISAQIAQVTPEIGAVAPKIAAIAADVTAIGMDVSAVSIPTGRCGRRGEDGAANRDGSHKYQNRLANHDDPPAVWPKFRPRQLKRRCSEPPVCREFMIDLSILSFRNVCGASDACVAGLVASNGHRPLGAAHAMRGAETSGKLRSPRQTCCRNMLRFFLSSFALT